SAGGTATPFSHDEIVGGFTPNAELSVLWSTGRSKCSVRRRRSRSDSAVGEDNGHTSSPLQDFSEDPVKSPCHDQMARQARQSLRRPFVTRIDLDVKAR